MLNQKTAGMILACTSILWIGVHAAAQCSKEKQEGKTAAEEECLCWPELEEVVNKNPISKQIPSIPEHLRGEDVKLKRAALSLKLCIDTEGNVDRVLVTKSTGNAEIDVFFQEVYSKWKFTPVEKDGAPVRSIFTVVISL